METFKGYKVISVDYGYRDADMNTQLESKDISAMSICDAIAETKVYNKACCEFDLEKRLKKHIIPELAADRKVALYTISSVDGNSDISVEQQVEFFKERGLKVEQEVIRTPVKCAWWFTELVYNERTVWVVSCECPEVIK